MTGLTPFLLAMMRTPGERLTSADPDKLARKYGIPGEWARFYIGSWVESGMGSNARQTAGFNGRG